MAATSNAKPGDLLTIKDAAEILGVSEMTLRRWDTAGKFKARRHPMNNYRVYRRADVSRAHRGRILYDIESAVAAASKAIDVLCEAWGTARRDEVEIPESEDGPIPIEQAIPGFWRFLLRDRSSELVGVLPGRSADHAEGLTKAFFAERREPEALVRSDFANGWTKYIQGQSAGVRRDGEAAIATWLVNDGALEYAEN